MVALYWKAAMATASLAVHHVDLQQRLLTLPQHLNLHHDASDLLPQAGLAVWTKVEEFTMWGVDWEALQDFIALSLVKADHLQLDMLVRCFSMPHVAVWSLSWRMSWLMV